MLTRKQYELLIFIDRHLRETGFSPSFEEMKEALQLKSKSGIHRLISALEERGFLHRRHHRARALEVVRLPEDLAKRAPAAQPAAQPLQTRAEASFSPNVIRGDFSGRLPGVRAAHEAGAVQLPLYGRIAAGLPIEALRDQGQQIEVPLALLGRRRALRARGRGRFDGRGRHPRRRHRHHPPQRDCRERPDRRGPGGRERGHAQAPAPPRQLDRPRARQPPPRDPHLPRRPGEGSGKAGGPPSAGPETRRDPV